MSRGAPRRQGLCFYYSPCYLHFDGDGDLDVATTLQAHGWGLSWFENLDGVGA
jgi:hypothetical protein